jgi:hypothetical protein
MKESWDWFVQNDNLWRALSMWGRLRAGRAETVFLFHPFDCTQVAIERIV